MSYMFQSADKEIIDLAHAKTGKDLLLVEICDKDLALKLIEMGCLPGMQICKQTAAPFHGPVLIKVFPNGNLLALRYEEAEKIQVKSPKMPTEGPNFIKTADYQMSN